ncbi:M56 family metallopeptidase [Streptomyces mobaraensis NBRC 13819 = DSM 40847]|uniref:Peptidase M48 Ste24p n=1 Tax=Streptomyces mobaraensis (strain ATCC 29032 / DSM 40847 / JCM 4168 / NBRC 13819 / NCIMB 11159 / IPCR 16-22) TaxID=1223523 RepID=M3B899_STRM1|nr:M56 family metallopeptidase [Streptomyces mobaraensis]EMF02228.1 peptidase M48 Ste24p [Streptomyces mobaraensis NBRC 13819 = DSM 40847]QTT72680.1 M56 family metallopeptidase [Streptomyces mobaraensis NBRC 13819 = DSM 40847]
MLVPLALLALGALIASLAPRFLARADWPDREPVLALWVWQCVVAAVLLCCALAMALSAAAAWKAVRGNVFAPAPSGVVEAYALGGYGALAAPMAVVLACGAVWTAAMLTREVRGARARRRRRRADLLVRSPRLPGEEPGGERLVLLESDRPDAWLLRGGPAPQLVITTGALRRLDDSQLDALLAHEQGHVRARHDWLLHCSSALANGFPQVPVFAAFRDRVHHLVELAADDVASRRFGRLTTALALVELNEDRGVFDPCAARTSQLPGRVDRLLAPAPRLTPARRLRLTATAALVPFVPVLVTFVPGLRALG